MSERVKADAAVGEVFDQELLPLIELVPYPEDVANKGLPAERVRGGSRVPAPVPAYNAGECGWEELIEDELQGGPSAGRAAVFTGMAVLGIGLVAVGSWPLNGLGVLGVLLAGAGVVGMTREVFRR